jgi:hypothetical protein
MKLHIKKYCNARWEKIRFIEIQRPNGMTFTKAEDGASNAENRKPTKTNKQTNKQTNKRV